MALASLKSRWCGHTAALSHRRRWAWQSESAALQGWPLAAIISGGSAPLMSRWAWQRSLLLRMATDVQKETALNGQRLALDTHKNNSDLYYSRCPHIPGIA